MTLPEMTQQEQFVGPTTAEATDIMFAAPERGLVATLWDAVRNSRFARGIGGLCVIGSAAAALTACGKAEAIQTPPAGSAGTSITGEQTPGQGSPSVTETTPSSNTPSPSSPTSLPSTRSSAQPSSPNTSSPSTPTTTNPNSSPSPSTHSAETLTLGVPVTFEGKDMKESARLPWETKKRGYELAKDLGVKSIPGGDTPEYVLGRFFTMAGQMINAGSGITLEDLGTYSRLGIDPKADQAAVRDAFVFALTGRDPSELQPSQRAWWTALDEIANNERVRVAITLDYDPATAWGDRTPLLTDVEATLTHCSSDISSTQMACNITVAVSSAYERKNDPKAKDMGTRKIRVEAFLDGDVWRYRVTFEDIKG